MPCFLFICYTLQMRKQKGEVNLSRKQYEINNLQFDIEDIKDLSDLSLLVIASKCTDNRKHFVDHEIEKRQKQAKRQHLRVIK